MRAGTLLGVFVSGKKVTLALYATQHKCPGIMVFSKYRKGLL